jgi:hypothetical protein
MTRPRDSDYACTAIAGEDRRPIAPGYLMAKSVEINNFRGFKKVRLEDCRRINVIVGENGSGKTALMEAIFLAAGTNAEIAYRLRPLRGFTDQIAGQHREIERSIWGDLFYEHNFKNTVLIKLRGSPAKDRQRTHDRSVSINFQDRNVKVPHSKKSKDAGWAPVGFVWRGHNDNLIYQSTPQIVDGKVTNLTGPPTQLNAAFWAANHTYSASETVNRFSELSRMSKAQEMIGNFTSQFTQISDLSIEMNAGSPMIYAKLEGQDEKLPLSLISGGINKLSSILFAMPLYSGGILLIDEIENGFFYLRLPEIWRSLMFFAEQYDVQIFASTHSRECLDALVEAGEDNPESISFIHTELMKGTATARQFHADTGFGALQLGDIR